MRYLGTGSNWRHDLWNHQGREQSERKRGLRFGSWRTHNNCRTGRWVCKGQKFKELRGRLRQCFITNAKGRKRVFQKGASVQPTQMLLR